MKKDKHASNYLFVTIARLDIFIQTTQSGKHLASGKMGLMNNTSWNAKLI